MMNLCSALQAFNVSYCFKDEGTHRLFSHVNFELGVGEAIQVVGRNGQGKTTLLRILAGLLIPLEGRVLWEGFCIQECPETYRMDLLYIGHLTALKGHLSAIENLALLARLRGYRVKDEHLMSALRRVGLERQWHQVTYQLSAGQRQRLALARLLVTPSRLWILDEPFGVLCQDGQRLIQEMMEQFLNSGGRVIFTSHHPLQLSGTTINLLTL